MLFKSLKNKSEYPKMNIDPESQKHAVVQPTDEEKQQSATASPSRIVVNCKHCKEVTEINVQNPLPHVNVAIKCLSCTEVFYSQPGVIRYCAGCLKLPATLNFAINFYTVGLMLCLFIYCYDHAVNFPVNATDASQAIQISLLIIIFMLGGLLFCFAAAHMKRTMLLINLEVNKQSQRKSTNHTEQLQKEIQHSYI